MFWHLKRSAGQVCWSVGKQTENDFNYKSEKFRLTEVGNFATTEQNVENNISSGSLLAGDI